MGVLFSKYAYPIFTYQRLLLLVKSFENAFIDDLQLNRFNWLSRRTYASVASIQGYGRDIRHRLLRAEWMGRNA